LRPADSDDHNNSDNDKRGNDNDKDSGNNDDDPDANDDRAAADVNHDDGSSIITINERQQHRRSDTDPHSATAWVAIITINERQQHRRSDTDPHSATAWVALDKCAVVLKHDRRQQRQQ
jgi:hypothetical protein